jgi:hypothetical protein
MIGDLTSPRDGLSPVIINPRDEVVRHSHSNTRPGSFF